MAGIAVVTGASGGIGFHAARALAEQGYKVYGLSRRAPAEAGITHIPVDLTNEAAVTAAFKQIKEESGHIDLLINNAGSGISGAAELTELAEVRAQFEINVFAMALCVRLAVPLMREKGGRIVNISSVAAVFSIPFQGFYSATKAAVNSLTLVYRNELKRFHISVCALMPGDTKTGFTSVRRKTADPQNLYGGADARAVALMEKDEENGMPAERVGKLAARLALKKRVRPFYTAGLQYKLFCFAARLLPAGLVNLAVGKLYMK